MTFGLMHAARHRLQQVSIASLIIALGLLVDDPVVAGDAIKRDLGAGQPPHRRGVARADQARQRDPLRDDHEHRGLPAVPAAARRHRYFLYSLPIVMTCSLVASRIVSMTFIPLLGYYLLRPEAPKQTDDGAPDARDSPAAYYRLGRFAHRDIAGRASRRRWSSSWLVACFMSQLKTQFFPKDLSYLSYVDVWLPEDAPLRATMRERDRRRTRDPRRGGGVRARRTHGDQDRAGPEVADDVRRRRRAALLVLGRPGAAPAELRADPHRGHRQALHQRARRAVAAALEREVAGRRLDVRQLETGKPVGIPVALRISGEDIADAAPISRRRSALVLRARP